MIWLHLNWTDSLTLAHTFEIDTLNHGAWRRKLGRHGRRSNEGGRLIEIKMSEHDEKNLIL
jgi:hypothetical protein